MNKLFFCFFTILFLGTTIPQTLYAQDAANDIFAADDDDLNVGGDIFTDFSEDVENAKVVEDERFYRYGRFFSFNASLGLTTFDGNRGIAYENQPPSFGMSFTFFKDFQTALGLGIEFSKHSMFLKDPVRGFPNAKTSDGKNAPPGFVDVSMLRVFFSYRYYIETANLGTAITYSNPYLIGRLEYWYQTVKYEDQSELPRDVGGGLGFGLGFGLEFPVELKESYIGLEFLAHSVNFPDKNSQKYAPLNDGGYGFENLGGNAYSTMVSYVFNW
ncbi:MAG: hypothetical protein KBD76_08935 [Bacteriovorax sp.]|nr:hypothetical protein [Bacteriovorax sp.]